MNITIKSWRPISGTISALIVVALGGAPARAQTPPPPAEDPDPLPKAAFQASAQRVDPFYGSFATKIPIEIPPFRGLEPQLALSYSSSGGNGFAGVGWNISGFSTIERTSAGKGAPFALIGPEPEDRAPDIYLLDGQELIPCAPGSSSPSCLAGGTHSAKVETWERIARAIEPAVPRAPRFQPELSGGELEVTWTITKKDGTEMLYVPMFVLPSDGYRDGLRWGLARARDRHGNEVLYGWRCDGWECYPDQVLYNGIAVTFNYELRPDPINYAIGAVEHARTLDRLKSVDVALGTSLVRAYQLTYQTSPETSRSILSSIQQFGNDASMDSSFGYSGGTSLPPIVATYSPDADGANHTFGEANDWGPRPVFAAWSSHWSGDFDGDGKTDLMYVPFAYSSYVVELSTGIDCPPPNGSGPCGFAPPSPWADFEFVPDWRAVWVLDLDKDGKDDILYVPYTETGYFARLSTGVTCPTQNGEPCGFAPPVMWSAFDPAVDWSAVWMRDASGDGLADLIHVSPLRDHYRVQLNTGAGFGPATDWAEYEYPIPFECVIYDGGTVGEVEPNGFGSNTHPLGFNGRGGHIQISGSMDGATYNDIGTGDLDLYSFNVAPGQTMKFSAHVFGAVNAFDTCNGDTVLHLIDYENCVAFNGCTGVDGLNSAIVASADNNPTNLCSSLENLMVTEGVYLVAVSRGFAPGPRDFPYALEVEVEPTTTCPSLSKQVWWADFNGDGKTDLMTLPNPLTVYAVRLSTGSSFGAPFIWADYQSVPHLAAIRTGDFNGDGKADVLYLSSGFDYYHVMLSAGNSFLPPQPWAPYAAVDHLNFSIWTADLNADGKTDLMYASGGNYQVSLSTGSSFAAPAVWAPYPGLPHLGAVWIQDFTGDGIADLLDYPMTSIGQEVRRGLGTPRADVVHGLSNGLGGGVALEYVRSNVWPSANAVPPVQTVTAIEVSDGRGQVARTTFSYDGALYDHADRRFLGFRHARVTKPCIAGELQCPREDMWFLQGPGSASKPERVEKRTGAGELLASTTSEYATNGSAVPHICLETARWTHEYAGAASRRSKVEKEYDELGNLTEERFLGDFDVAGDEHTKTTAFRPNLERYIVGLPAATALYAGIGTGGARLEETRNIYDDASSWNEPPVVGDKTSELRWSDTLGDYVASFTEYDAFGNITATEDANGVRETMIYDSTYQLYEISATNALGHVETNDWDAACGKKTRTTNANGQSTFRSHDALCRTIRLDLPLGNFVATSYLDIGSAGSQRVRRETPASWGGAIWEETRFDGLGRVYRTVKSGPELGQQIADDTTYNARGLTAGETAPYYAGDAAPLTTHEYDALDRRTRTTHPDGSFTLDQYGAGEVTTTDELGHVTVVRRDVFGSIVERREQLGAGFAITRFAYDARLKLENITDAAGNSWSYTYDSLGQMTVENDPDRGLRSYQHDAGGRLIAALDAKGQRTELTYDAIGREETKTLLAGTPSASTTTRVYDEPRAGYFNIGKLTTILHASATQTFDYDAAERAVRHTSGIDGQLFSFQRGYDAAGRLAFEIFPDGDSIGSVNNPIRYNAAGWIQVIPGFVAAATYIADGSLAEIFNDNGTHTERTYSPERRRLTRIRTTRGDVVVQDSTYTHDVEGKITHISSPFANEAWNYLYDERHRLVGAANETSAWDSDAFAYDAVGNIIESSRIGCYSYPAPGSPRPHGVIQAGDTTHQYDANGNMISWAGHTVTWDGEDRIASIDGDTFAYDASGDRVRRVSGGETTLYPSPEYEVGPGGVATKYVKLGRIVVGKRVGTARYWLHADHLGSTQAVTDVNGYQVQRLAYRSYGAGLSELTPHAQTVSYVGEHRDANGLMYLHARYYDPSLGVFLSPDTAWPLDRGVGLHRYAYSGGDPINYRDPSGNQAENNEFRIYDYVEPWHIGVGFAVSPCITEPKGCVDYARDFIAKWKDPGNAARAAAEAESSHSMVSQAKHEAEEALKKRIAQLTAAGDQAAAQAAKAELAAMEAANRQGMSYASRVGQALKAVYFKKWTGATPHTVELAKKITGKLGWLSNPWTVGAGLLFHSSETGGCDSSGRCRDMIYRDPPQPKNVPHWP